MFIERYYFLRTPDKINEVTTHTQSRSQPQCSGPTSPTQQPNLQVVYYIIYANPESHVPPMHHPCTDAMHRPACPPSQTPSRPRHQAIPPTQAPSALHDTASHYIEV